MTFEARITGDWIIDDMNILLCCFRAYSVASICGSMESGSRLRDAGGVTVLIGSRVIAAVLVQTGHKVQFQLKLWKWWNRHLVWTFENKFRGEGFVAVLHYWSQQAGATSLYEYHCFEETSWNKVSIFCTVCEVCHLHGLRKLEFCGYNARHFAKFGIFYR